MPKSCARIFVLSLLLFGRKEMKVNLVEKQRMGNCSYRLAAVIGRGNLNSWLSTSIRDGSVP